MTLGKFCVIAIAILATTTVHAQVSPSAPFKPPAPSVVPDISPEEALELAAWAREQSGGAAGITAADVKELEAWAQAQKNAKKRNPIQAVSSPLLTGPTIGSDTQAPASTPSGAIPQVVPNRMAPIGPYNGYAPRQGFYTPGIRSARNFAPPGYFQPRGPFAGAVNFELTQDPAQQPEQLPAPGEGTAADGEVIDDGLITKGMIWGEVWGLCYAMCDSGVFGGVEGTFLAPFGEPAQTVTLTNLVNNNAYTGNSQPGFGGGVRTWLGVAHANGWGWRVRYWHFGDRHMDLDPVVPVGNGPAFQQNYFLNIDTLDVELTQRFYRGGWNMYTSFGARWARMERNASVLGYGTLGDVDLYGLAVGANKIEGTGFTGSIGARAPLWHKCCGGKGCVSCGGGGWSWLWGARVSVLWADSTTSALTEASSVVKPPIGAATANSRDKAFASKDHNENVFIAEALLGVQYERCLTCLPATVFFRGAVEYQHWRTGDVSANSDSFAFLQGGAPAFGGRVDASANGHDGDLDLIGFTFGGGIVY